MSTNAKEGGAAGLGGGVAIIVGASMAGVVLAGLDIPTRRRVQLLAGRRVTEYVRSNDRRRVVGVEIESREWSRRRATPSWWSGSWCSATRWRASTRRPARG